jgi:3-phenylpropionate/trans-cinnamate dioxygenase subunit beta
VAADVISSQRGLRERITEFYALETSLLDDGKLHDWLALLDEGIRYTMPVRDFQMGELPAETLTKAPFYLFNDDKASLEMRVARIDTGLSLTDSPPPSTQRLVTDVLILYHNGARVRARSSFIVYFVRDEQNDAFFIGRRVDELREIDTTFRIVRREILLAQHILPRAIPIFF